MLYTLKGGYVYTNKEIKQINVIVDNNEIVEISDSVRGQIIDVTGLYVAPSFIDPHVHMREPGFTDSETIKTGSRAAARGCGQRAAAADHPPAPCAGSHGHADPQDRQRRDGADLPLVL